MNEKGLKDFKVNSNLVLSKDLSSKWTLLIESNYLHKYTKDEKDEIQVIVKCQKESSKKVPDLMSLRVLLFSISYTNTDVVRTGSINN